MTLEQARELIRRRGGEIKFFVLHRDTIPRMLEEALGGIPMVVVPDDKPEGVVVW
jgi:hypothetical protein